MSAVVSRALGDVAQYPDYYLLSKATLDRFRTLANDADSTLDDLTSFDRLQLRWAIAGSPVKAGTYEEEKHPRDAQGKWAEKPDDLADLSANDQFWKNWVVGIDPVSPVKFAWDESKHPRHAAGTAEGGQFAPKDLGVIAGEFNKVPPEMRVWQGKSHPMPEQKPSKLATGAFGERVASQVLSALKKAPFGSLNVTANNIAIDVIGDHLAVEVKTGLATNGLKAQQWRATIGEPGETEKALIKQMSPEEKRRANQFKEAKILERKREKLKTLSEMAGGRVEGKTVCQIVSPDLKAADVFIVDGFHLRLGWNKFATDEYYLGTFRAA